MPNLHESEARDRIGVSQLKVGDTFTTMQYTGQFRINSIERAEPNEIKFECTNLGSNKPEIIILDTKDTVGIIR
jgi:hypothetical protein